VQTVALSWQHAGEVAAVLAVTGLALGRSGDRRVRAVGAFVREAAMIGLLYGLWQLAGRLSVTGTSGAMRRAHWIQRFEHDVFLPSERSVQNLVLPHPLVRHTIDLYYATMHFTMMFVFLIWMFVRHREHYRPVRTVLAWTTLCCLLVQLMPVAPPRMLPGIVDLAMVDHLSVYAGGSAVDQLSAMPSVHVAWAVLIGWYAWRVGGSAWRYLGPAHAVITVFVVVATGNHWWLDGIVATGLLVACAWGVYGARLAWRRLRLALVRAPVEQPLREAAQPDGVSA
jgi:hypothetical protein